MIITTSGGAVKSQIDGKSEENPQRIEVPQQQIDVPQRWDRETTETFAVCPLCRRQCFDDAPETCCRHRVGLVIDAETCRGYVRFAGLPSCPCSPEQTVKPGFRYCADCLSIASTDDGFREEDYRVRGEAS